MLLSCVKGKIMRRAYIGCTVALFIASGAVEAQAQKSGRAAILAEPGPSSEAIENYNANYTVPIPITVRAYMPVLRGTHLTNSRTLATWVYIYRPLDVSSMPTTWTLSRVSRPHHRREF